MKNEDLWKQYQDYTKSVSDNGRTLAFSAAAICWLFKDQNSNPFPARITVALGFVVIFFVFDMLQPLISALLIRVWTRKEEKRMYRDTRTIEGNYNKPAWLDWPGFCLWWLKFVALAVSFFYIALHLLSPTATSA